MSPESVENPLPRGLLALASVAGILATLLPAFPAGVALPISLLAGIWTLAPMFLRGPWAARFLSSALSSTLFLGLNLFFWSQAIDFQTPLPALFNLLLLGLALFLFRREGALVTTLLLPVFILAGPAFYSWQWTLAPIPALHLGFGLVAIFWIRGLECAGKRQAPGEGGFQASILHFIFALGTVLMFASPSSLFIHGVLACLIIGYAALAWSKGQVPPAGAEFEAKSETRARTHEWLLLFPALGVVVLLALGWPWVSAELAERTWRDEGASTAILHPSWEAMKNTASPVPPAEPETEATTPPGPEQSPTRTSPSRAPAGASELGNLKLAPPTVVTALPEGGILAGKTLFPPEDGAISALSGHSQNPSRNLREARRDESPDLVLQGTESRDGPDRNPAAFVPAPEPPASRLGISPTEEKPLIDGAEAMGDRPATGEAFEPSIPANPGFAPASPRMDLPPADEEPPPQPSTSLHDLNFGPAPVIAQPGLGAENLAYSNRETIDLRGTARPIGEFTVPGGTRVPERIYLRATAYDVLVQEGFEPAGTGEKVIKTPPTTAAPTPFRPEVANTRERWWDLRLVSSFGKWLPLPTRFQGLAGGDLGFLMWDLPHHRVAPDNTLPRLEIRFDRPDFAPSIPAAEPFDTSRFTRLFAEPSVDQRLRALSLRIAGRPNLAPKSFARRAIRHLQDNAEYRLAVDIPPGEDPTLVRWLENQRDGYCEHFAGAFVLLARAYGIPARPVTGLLLSDYDRASRRFLIYPSNAHAWAEILIEDEWVRVEPTPPSHRLRTRAPGTRLAEFTFEAPRERSAIAPLVSQETATTKEEFSKVEDSARTPDTRLLAAQAPAPEADPAPPSILVASTAGDENVADDLPAPPDIARPTPPPATVELGIGSTHEPRISNAEEQAQAILSTPKDQPASPPRVSPKSPATPAPSGMPDPAPVSWMAYVLFAGAVGALAFIVLRQWRKRLSAPSESSVPDAAGSVRARAGRLLFALEKGAARAREKLSGDAPAELRHDLMRLRYERHPTAERLSEIEKRWDASK